MSEHQRVPGEVWLVGAGPGPVDLLTLRALRLMRQADVVVYDRLVGADVLELVPARTERIFVGKMRDRHVCSQEGSNRLLVDLARAGRRVLRLKGGDPFIFGRGGEELEALAAAGIPFQVVPGVTAALGCAAYAGIPLTHREHAQTLIFVTGHTKDGEPDLDWPTLARPGQTLVVYMGIKALGGLCRKLIDHGLPATTPAALIENGTYDHQRVVPGTLATLPGRAPEPLLAGPTLIIVGEVVALAQRLAWFAGAGDRQEPVLSDAD
jgi:uroporphyrin-III C-methyltransferase / precorrin-2 dehydrogenase / sirohydrochlorin ferrochelatase